MCVFVKDGDSLPESTGRLDAETGKEVEAGTQKSRASLARVSELTLESLRQVTDLVKVRAELKEALALQKVRGHEHEETISKLKSDLTLMGKKIDKVTIYCNNLLTDRSQAVDFEAKIHAVLRGKEVELVGVGMVVKLEGRSRYPMIKSLTPGGAAASSDLAVGDSILTVNGKDVEGSEPSQLTPLFFGPMGSSLTLIAARMPAVGGGGGSAMARGVSDERGDGARGSMEWGWWGRSQRSSGDMSRASVSMLTAHSFTVTLVRATFSASFNTVSLQKDRPESLELVAFCKSQLYIYSVYSHGSRELTFGSME